MSSFGVTVHSKKSEYGCRVLYSGFPSFCCAIGGRSYSNFLAAPVYGRFQRLGAPSMDLKNRILNISTPKKKPPAFTAAIVWGLSLNQISIRGS